MHRLYVFLNPICPAIPAWATAMKIDRMRACRLRLTPFAGLLLNTVLPLLSRWTGTVTGSYITLLLLYRKKERCSEAKPKTSLTRVKTPGGRPALNAAFLKSKG